LESGATVRGAGSNDDARFPDLDAAGAMDDPYVRSLELLARLSPESLHLR